MREEVVLAKQEFVGKFKEFVKNLQKCVSCEDGQWSIKGFIDAYKNIFTISTDTKIVSKILEIHLFPSILKFAEGIGYSIVLAEKQNYYPDLTFVNKENQTIKFAVDLKTTFRRPNGKTGFTLGSHGAYFENRKSTKNIQFPYEQYYGHFCLGVIYSKTNKNVEEDDMDLQETQVLNIDELGQPANQDDVERVINKKATLLSVTSVIKDLDFFFSEKWKIASDSQGSGNTANIGSVTTEKDMKEETGVFSKLGEEYFDAYWLNYNKAIILIDNRPLRITNIWDFLEWKGERDKFNLVGNGAKRKPERYGR